MRKEVRDALHLEEGSELKWEVRDGKLEVTWEIGGGNVEATTGRPAFWRWEGFIKVGPGNVVDDLAKARELAARIVYNFRTVPGGIGSRARASRF